MSPLRRRFELARLIAEHYEGFEGHALSSKLALELADSLAAFFDSLALEEVDAGDKLDSLVHGEGADEYTLAAWAEHWQVSARFLAIAVRRWPERLLELERMDPSQRQVVLIRRLADQWRERPPATPLILAGTTGSAPSTADLADIVARAPLGAVVLPGLDLSLADDAWRQIEDSHPQATMKRMLDRHGVRRDDVREWPASVDADRKARARRRLINEALRPAAATADWRDQIAALKAESASAVEDGLDGLFEIHSARDEEAASAIALLMRETLETPHQVAALITPDLTLARRVAARLTRWGLTPDISAGEPLSASPVGRFLLDLLALMTDPADPVRLLDLLHNPLSRFAGRREVTTIDLRALRGATPNDAAMIASALVGREEALAVWGDFTAHLAPILTGFGDAPVDLGATLTRFVQVAESLAKADSRQDRGQVLWAGAPGAEASSLLSELIREGTGFAVRHAREFGDIVGALIHKAKVRSGGNFHPRLLILGAIESRLVKADRIILAGLEEGVWPQAPDNDPFLSRPMRAKLGLPSPERRTGLSAHDFVQGATAREVYLVTRHRREGEPQVQSRWLWRLQTLCQGAGATIQTHPDIIDWARALDCGLPVKPPELKPAHQPAPAPPLEARPVQMSVTDVETFVRDPYAIYAKRILKLRPIDRPNEPVEARQRGTAIHKSVERFVAEDVPLGDEGTRRLTGLLEQELAATHLSPAQMALQRPLLPGMAAGFVDFEATRRAARPRIRIEQDGKHTFTTGRGDFTVTARADRLEVREDGADIIDFKTGGHASVKQVLAGFYPQLTLTAAILRRGGFDGIAAGTPVGDMVYVRLSPDKTAVRPVRDKATGNDDLAEIALARLKSRILAFDDPKKGYKSWTAPQFLKGRGGDYDQLARLYEWYVLGDDEAPDSEEADA